MSLLVLSASDVSKVTSRFSPDELVDLMADVFARLSAHDPGIVQPHRTVVNTEHHTALAQRDVSCSPVQQLRHSYRSPGSLLATRLLLGKSASPTSIVAIGAGAQIQAHLSLFLAAYPSIRTCTIFNRSQNARVASLRERIHASFPHVKTEAGLLAPSEGYNGPSLKDAIGGASIIITATSSTSPLFPSDCVRAGTHLCLIGSYKPEMHEIDTDLVKRTALVVVDQKSACLAEAGELISAGYTASDLVELGELVDLTPHNPESAWAPRADAVQHVRQSGDVTIFKSVGVGVQDVAIACAVVNRAVKDGIGKIIDDYDAELVDGA
ncbi:NAD(P)-binding protein [Daedaleopsis nitida]|nr:NAD(P)-binding protein [Daedaleopsis nitida]